MRRFRVSINDGPVSVSIDDGPIGRRHGVLINDGPIRSDMPREGGYDRSLLAKPMS